jgi:hypothetical protein
MPEPLDKDIRNAHLLKLLGIPLSIPGILPIENRESKENVRNYENKAQRMLTTSLFLLKFLFLHVLFLFFTVLKLL